MRNVLAAFVLAAAAAPAGDSHFAYDPNAPLDATKTGAETRGDVVIQDLTYASPKGGRVPAYLVVPAGKGPFAAVLWGHWYWENSPMKSRRQFLDEAVVLARSGVVSLLTDGPVARTGYTPDPTPLNVKQFDDLVQQVVDMRRGADLLLARPEVDPRRLAFVGHSYNAAVGAILAGVDRRFKAFVLMAGALSDQVDYRSAEYKRYREKVGPSRWDAFTAEHAWADPGPYVARAAPAAVFLQYAMRENFLTPARAKEYAANVSEPKRFALYAAPHALNAEARRDRLAFLAEMLSVPPPDPAAVAAVPDLVQPPPPPR
ncbi:MAG: alpha/beta hydrolase family protein [Thermoanaerobaculia bacterium]